MATKYEKSLIKEASEIGVEFGGRCVDITHTKKHLRVILCIKGVTQFVVVAKTPSDHRARANHRRNVRTEYRNLLTLTGG
ncbi:MAG: hypothetical protein DRQ42_07100 [Gammaproteobacteria bacterium]|nr:MAG: hypothetical protein DRQ42_07100 [Gammaproteobacteria bacterium]